MAVTVCYAWQGAAKCERYLEVVPTVADCVEKGRLHVEYVRAADPEGRVLIWAGARCEGGLFG